MGPVAFETVVTAHHPEIRRYLLRITRHSAAADDLSQETFLRAYRAYRTLSEDANVRAWLFAIATNLHKNHLRSEKRRSTFHAAVRLVKDETDGQGPEDQTLFQETKGLIEGVVDRLPFKQRTAFVLRKIHDLDYEAIARSLDCSAESARAHVFQALRKIRQSLNGHGLPVTEVSR